MSSDSKDKIRTYRSSVFKSFVFASSGIWSAVKSERNIRIHLMAAVIVLIMGFFLELTAGEWVVICLTIAGMLSLELMNTAVERTVDLVTAKYHPLAKQAKDIAAAAVFIYAIAAIVIGLIIFLPKIMERIS